MTDETEVPQDLAAAEPVIEPEESAEEGAAAETTETPEVPAEPSAEPEPKSKDVPAWVQKRFDEMTRQRHQEREAREQAEAKAEALQALIDAGAPADGKTYTEAELETRAATLAEQRAAAQAFDGRCNAAYDAGEKAFGDQWSASIKNLGMAGLVSPTDTAFLEAALATDAPEQVLHALGQDPDEAMRIAALPPMKRAIEMDRLATKLAKPAAPPERKAPPPVAPIDGGANPAFDPEKASMPEWLAWREKNAAAH